jgi:hypothetical protein
VHGSFVFSPVFQQIPTIKHGFSTRLGGYSTEAYQSFNLGLHVDDDPLIVEKNTHRALKLLELKDRKIVRLKQIHSSRVVKIEDPVKAKPWVADACWSENSDLALCILVADCLPILLSDADGSFIAAVHKAKSEFSDQQASATHGLAFTGSSILTTRELWICLSRTIFLSLSSKSFKALCVFFSTIKGSSSTCKPKLKD